MYILEQKIRDLPTRKFKLNPTSAMGSYVDSCIEMVRLEDTLQVIRDLLNEPELRGLTGLLDKFRQETENQFRCLPVKKFKIDPLSQYNKTASLFIEEEYIELNDAIALIQRWRDSFEEISNFIVESLCQLIQWKEARLSGSQFGQFTGGEINLPELKGKKEEISRSRLIRDRAISELCDLQSVRNLSSRAKAQIEEVVSHITSAAWWIKNSHRTSFAILLQISNALDEALLAEFVGVSDPGA